MNTRIKLINSMVHMSFIIFFYQLKKTVGNQRKPTEPEIAESPENTGAPAHPAKNRTRKRPLIRAARFRDCKMFVDLSIVSLILFSGFHLLVLKTFVRTKKRLRSRFSSGSQPLGSGPLFTALDSHLRYAAADGLSNLHPYRYRKTLRRSDGRDR